MNTEQLLKPIIEKALAVAETTGEFVIEQAPLLLQEFYAWHYALNISWIIINLITIILPFIIHSKLKYLWDRGDEDNQMLYMIPMIVSGILAFVSLICILFNIFDLLKLMVAPKLYLIEHFKHLI
jgi:hypothetical protein